MLRYIIIFGYLIFIAGLGSLFAKQKNTGSFFLAGRSMHWFPVALSYVASLTSAISFMAMPQYTYQFAMLPAANEILVVLFALPVMVFIFLPLYMRIGSVSIYEFLELRYSLGIRIMGSVLFILNRFIWMGMVIYVPSMVLSFLTGITLWKLILIIGTLTTIYTCLGGMKAVIWTDVAQFTIFFVGLFVVLFVIAGRIDGGLIETVKQGVSLGKIKFFRWGTDLVQPNTWVLAFGAIYGFQNYASDQVVVQRFMSTKSLRESIISFCFSCGVNYVMIFLMFLVGAFLFVFYQNFPAALPADLGLDYIYPHFIKNELPLVFGSFLIAAIMAASMSSIDSGLNSVSAVLVTDYYQRLSKKRHSEQYYLRLSRILTVALGILVTIVGLFVFRIGKNIIDTVLYTAGWFAPPLSAIFLLGAVSKKVNIYGAIATFILGPAIMITLRYKTSLPSWTFTTVGMTVCLIIGYTVSLFTPRPASDKLKYSIWNAKVEKDKQADEEVLEDKR